MRVYRGTLALILFANTTFSRRLHVTCYNLFVTPFYKKLTLDYLNFVDSSVGKVSEERKYQLKLFLYLVINLLETLSGEL